LKKVDLIAHLQRHAEQQRCAVPVLGHDDPDSPSRPWHQDPLALDGMPMEALRHACAEHGLDIGGRRRCDLVKRLYAHLQHEPGAAEQALPGPAPNIAETPSASSLYSRSVRELRSLSRERGLGSRGSKAEMRSLQTTPSSSLSGSNRKLRSRSPRSCSAAPQARLEGAGAKRSRSMESATGLASPVTPPRRPRHGSRSPGGYARGTGTTSSHSGHDTRAHNLVAEQEVARSIVLRQGRPEQPQSHQQREQRSQQQHAALQTPAKHEELQHRITRRFRGKSPDPRLSSGCLQDAVPRAADSAQPAGAGGPSCKAPELMARASLPLTANQLREECERHGPRGGGWRQPAEALPQSGPAHGSPYHSPAAETDGSIRYRRLTKSPDPRSPVHHAWEGSRMQVGPSHASLPRAPTGHRSLSAPSTGSGERSDSAPTRKGRPPSRPITYACRSRSASGGRQPSQQQLAPRSQQALLPPPPAGWRETRNLLNSALRSPSTPSSAGAKQGRAGSAPDPRPREPRRSCTRSRSGSRGRTYDVQPCHALTTAGRPCQNVGCLRPGGARFHYCPIHSVRWHKFERR